MDQKQGRFYSSLQDQCWFWKSSQWLKAAKILWPTEPRLTLAGSTVDSRHEGSNQTGSICRLTWVKCTMDRVWSITHRFLYCNTTWPRLTLAGSTVDPRHEGSSQTGCRLTWAKCTMDRAWSMRDPQTHRFLYCNTAGRRQTMAGSTVDPRQRGF